MYQQGLRAFVALGVVGDQNLGGAGACPFSLKKWNFVEFTVNFPYAIAKSNFPQ